jgi:rfaE bifunctional protein kinase chain/domain
MFLASPRSIIENIVRAHNLIEDDWGQSREVTLPGFSMNIKDMVDALRTVAGDIVADRIDWKPDPFIQNILDAATKNKVPVYVDPKKENFFHFKGVRLFKPNFNEFISGMESGKIDEKIEERGFRLQKQLKAEILLITQGEKGMVLFSDNSHQAISTKARHVHDVSGAGDTVIATFTLSDICGASTEESVTLSNYAAGRVCEEVGVVHISLKMLDEVLSHHNSI